MYIVVEKVHGDTMSKSRVTGPFTSKKDAEEWLAMRKEEVKAAPITKMYLKRGWTVRPLNSP